MDRWHVLDFVEKTNLRIKNWELENPVTWRDRGAETATDYVLVNEEVSRGSIAGYGKTKK